jgi:branched-chain amino acid transport system permease protein
VIDQLPQQLIIGLSIGASYALIALGYTMVYGVLRLINFAHGDIYMVGAVTGYYIINALLKQGSSVGIALAVAFAGAIVICAILGAAIEFFAYRPLRNRPRLVVLITAIGVSMFLENVVQLNWIFGPTPLPFPQSVKALLGRPVVDSTLGNSHIIISRVDVLTFGLAITLMTVLTWIVLKTRIGLALRAVSHRFDTATLMGINTNRVISFTFILGSSLAAVAGVLDGLRYNVQPLMGVTYGLKAFIAAVLGGIGSIPGALVGSLLIGITESLVLSSNYGRYVDAIAFVFLILILLVKPAGLFGHYTPEKL